MSEKTGVLIATDKSVVTVRWGGYDYDIRMDRIKSPIHIIHWLNQLLDKDWEGTTPEGVQSFINTVCRAKGWPAWDSEE